MACRKAWRASLQPEQLPSYTKLASGSVSGGKSGTALLVSPTVSGAFCSLTSPPTCCANGTITLHCSTHAVYTIRQVLTVFRVLLRTLTFPMCDGICRLPVLSQNFCCLSRDKVGAKYRTQERPMLTRPSHQIQPRYTHCEHV